MSQRKTPAQRIQAARRPLSALAGGAAYLCALGALLCYAAAEFSPALGWANRRVFFIAVFWVCVFQAGRWTGAALGPDGKRRAMKAGLVSMALVYAVFCANILLIDSLYRMPDAGFPWTAAGWAAYAVQGLNLVPGRTVARFLNGWLAGRVAFGDAFINTVGNLVLLTPFAFFLPPVFERQNRFRGFLATMLAADCLVEILQFVLRTGTCDVDDVILNVSGAAAAYAVLHVRRIKRALSGFLWIGY